MKPARRIRIRQQSLDLALGFKTMCTAINQDYMVYIGALLEGIYPAVIVVVQQDRSLCQPQSIQAHGRAVGGSCGLLFSACLQPTRCLCLPCGPLLQETSTLKAPFKHLA